MIFKKTQPPEQSNFALYELWNSYNNIFQLFNPFPDEYDDTQTDYYYFGWESINGSWLIRKRSKTSSLYTEANNVNNPTYATLALAWVDRVSLTYP